MKIEFTGRQTEISREVRRLAERKLEKVAKVLPRLTRAHVIVTADKHRQIAEVSVHSRNLDLTAVEESTNPRLSVSNAMDKFLRQAQRQQQKRRERKGKSTARRLSERTIGPEMPKWVKSISPNASACCFPLASIRTATLRRLNPCSLGATSPAVSNGTSAGRIGTIV